MKKLVLFLFSIAVLTVFLCIAIFEIASAQGNSESNGTSGSYNPPAWKLKGNAGISSAQFLGTTDTVSLKIRINNAEKIRLNKSGQLIVGAISAQTIGARDSAVTSNGTTSNPIIIASANSKVAAISAQVLDGTRNRRTSMFCNDSLSLWGLSNVGSSGSSTFALIQGQARALTILSNLNVGIGTTTPTQKLQVAGTIYSSSGGFMFPDGTTQNTATSLNNLLPTQTSNANKFLQTNATNASWFDLFGTSNTFTNTQTINTSNAGLKITGNSGVTNPDVWFGSSAPYLSYTKWTNNTNNYGELYYKITGGSQGWWLNIAGSYGTTYDYNNRINLAHGGYAWSFGADAASFASLNLPTYHDVKIRLFSGNDASRYLRFCTDNTGGAYTDRLCIQGYANSAIAYFNNVSGLGINNTSPKNTLDVAGSVGAAIVIKTANYTLTSTDHTVIFNGTSLTATLPSASTSTDRIYVVVNQNVSALTISSFNNLSNSATTTVASGTSIMLQTDGTTWYQIK